MKLFETTGCVDFKAQPLREYLRKLDDHHELCILGLIYSNPALQLHEICNKVEEITAVVVSIPTICRRLRRNGITRKIRQVAIQRSVDMKAEFIANISFYLVGYALKGESLVNHHLLVKEVKENQLLQPCLLMVW